MPKCVRCKAVLPPNFMDEGNCLFCKDNLIVITYGAHGEKRASKTELVKEYEQFLGMLKEQQVAREKVLKGRDNTLIPEKLIG